MKREYKVTRTIEVEEKLNIFASALKEINNELECYNEFHGDTVLVDIDITSKFYEDNRTRVYTITITFFKSDSSFVACGEVLLLYRYPKNSCGLKTTNKYECIVIKDKLDDLLERLRK